MDEIGIEGIKSVKVVVVNDLIDGNKGTEAYLPVKNLDLKDIDFPYFSLSFSKLKDIDVDINDMRLGTQLEVKGFFVKKEDVDVKKNILFESVSIPKFLNRVGTANKFKVAVSGKVHRVKHQIHIDAKVLGSPTYLVRQSSNVNVVVNKSKSKFEKQIDEVNLLEIGNIVEIEGRLKIDENTKSKNHIIVTNDVKLLATSFIEKLILEGRVLRDPVENLKATYVEIERIDRYKKSSHPNKITVVVDKKSDIDKKNINKVGNVVQMEGLIRVFKNIEKDKTTASFYPTKSPRLMVKKEKDIKNVAGSIGKGV